MISLCKRLAVVLVIISLIHHCNALYMPSVAPASYPKGYNKDLELKVVKMTSVRTQLPYEYYDLPFCKPDEIRYTAGNLGEVLRGDRVMNSLYNISVLENDDCRLVCSIDYKKEDSDKFQKRIKQQYYVQWLLDNLPAATPVKSSKAHRKRYVLGFRLGFVGTELSRNHAPDAIYINNHVDITILYHDNPAVFKGYRIVGFEVQAKSIHSDSIEVASDKSCKITEPSVPQPMDSGKLIKWTYKVKWVHSVVPWASRWDVYLALTDGDIHWYSIINSLIIVLFLTGILAMIIIRTLRRDISRYNDEEIQDEAMEETGWKLVHGDVFRPPKYAALLAACLGSGIQIFGMTMVTIIFAMLGFLSPASRGGLITSAIALFVVMGLFAGYLSARIYKTCKGQYWKRASVMTGVLYPGCSFALIIFLNFFNWGVHSTAAIPIVNIIAIMALWFGLSIPLVLIGSYFGYRKRPYEHPVRTNQIPRQVPDQIWYMRPIVSMLLAGVLPFGAVFIELYFIMTAVWQNQFYYIFGFLFIVFLILIITCSEITIVMIYFQLCSEDYHWWWRSIFMSGGVAFYVFVYSIFYFIFKLDIEGFIPALLYFSYSLLMVFTFWFLTGMIGFYASYFFLRKIYSSVKVE